MPGLHEPLHVPFSFTKIYGSKWSLLAVASPIRILVITVHNTISLFIPSTIGGAQNKQSTTNSIWKNWCIYNPTEKWIEAHPLSTLILVSPLKWLSVTLIFYFKILKKLKKILPILNIAFSFQNETLKWPYVSAPAGLTVCWVFP